jgi:hypothetical protein
MTPAERAKKAVDGMRLRNDELGRGPSHDDVEALMAKVIEDTIIDMSMPPVLVVSHMSADKDKFKAEIEKIQLERPIVINGPHPYNVGDRVTLVDGTEGCIVSTGPTKAP